jgi:hypothetical protein
MPTPEHVMSVYVSLWNASDETERRQLAEEALAEDALVSYPTIACRGRADTVAAISRVQEQMPGMHFVATSGVEQHHGWLRASWRLIQSDGTVRMDGEDVAELAADGRLARVIGFHDPLPPRS